jgi:hypothetical protein
VCVFMRAAQSLSGLVAHARLFAASESVCVCLERGGVAGGRWHLRHSLDSEYAFLTDGAQLCHVCRSQYLHSKRCFLPREVWW